MSERKWKSKRVKEFNSLILICIEYIWIDTLKLTFDGIGRWTDKLIFWASSLTGVYFDSQIEEHIFFSDSLHSSSLVARFPLIHLFCLSGNFYYKKWSPMYMFVAATIFIFKKKTMIKTGVADTSRN